MSMYDLEGLIKMWEFNQISSEQAIGQLFLQVKALSQRVKELEWAVGVEGETKSEVKEAAVGK